MEDYKDYRALKYENYPELKRSQLSFYTDRYSVEHSEAAFPIIKEALERVGVNIELENVYDNDNPKYRLDISIDPEVYLTARMRFAGPKQKGFTFPDSKYGLAGDFILFSDVIYLLQTMSDKEIMEALNIKYASFYRHKKVMLESDYYKTADKDRLGDLDYLKGEELAPLDKWF